MKIRVEENEYNGSISYQIVPRKYNEDKEEGLKGKDVLILKSKFDSKQGEATQKTDSKFSKAGSKFNWGFVKVEWVNMPPEYEQYLDDYQGISLSYGGINNIRGFNDRHIPKDEVFYIASVPFIAKDGAMKKSITLEKLEHLTVRQYKLAVIIKNNDELGYLDTYTYKDEDGEKHTEPINKIIPFWAFCVDEPVLRQYTESPKQDTL